MGAVRTSGLVYTRIEHVAGITVLEIRSSRWLGICQQNFSSDTVDGHPRATSLAACPAFSISVTHEPAADAVNYSACRLCARHFRNALTSRFDYLQPAKELAACRLVESQIEPCRMLMMVE